MVEFYSESAQWIGNHPYISSIFVILFSSFLFFVRKRFRIIFGAIELLSGVALLWIVISTRDVHKSSFNADFNKDFDYDYVAIQITALIGSIAAFVRGATTIDEHLKSK